MAPEKPLIVKVVQKANSASNASNISAHIPTNSSSKCYYSNVSAIDGMEGHEFEYFCANILRRVGFSNVSVTPGSGDQGVDILATKDGVKYAIQCKSYASALSNTPVQEVSAGRQFYGCHVGVVMTNSTFTPGAIQLANATNILLWDRKKLEELIDQAGGLLNLGIQPKHNNIESNTDKDSFKEDNNKNDNPLESIKEPVITKQSQHPRPRMKLWSTICFCWSILCFLVLLLGLAMANREIITVGLGEGLFVLVIAIMLNAFAKSPKTDPDIQLYGLHIKKPAFVLICIIVAYIFLFVSMGITGSFDAQHTQPSEEAPSETTSAVTQ